MTPVAFCCNLPHRHAGTDCRVFLQLHGKACISPCVELAEPAASAAAPAPLQTGGIDSFRLQLPQLGRLKLAQLWLEGRGSPWHLELLVVTGPDGERLAGLLKPLPLLGTACVVPSRAWLCAASATQVSKPSSRVATGWAARVRRCCRVWWGR